MDPPENMVRCMVNNYSTMGFWRSWHRSYNLWTVRYVGIPGILLSRHSADRRRFLLQIHLRASGRKQQPCLGDNARFYICCTMARSFIPSPGMGMACQSFHFTRDHWQEGLAGIKGRHIIPSPFHIVGSHFANGIVRSHLLVSACMRGGRCTEYPPDDDRQFGWIRHWRRWDALYAQGTGRDVGR